MGLYFTIRGPETPAPVVPTGAVSAARTPAAEFEDGRSGLRVYSLHTMAEKEGPDFGKLAVALGFLPQEDLEKILRIQSDLHKIGVDRRLGELLLEKRILSREQILLVLRAQGKRIMTCHACRKS